MTLTDPQSALAESSTFIDYLVGLAGVGRLVRALAAQGSAEPGEADDFVYLLLGLAGLGSGIERLTRIQHRAPAGSFAAEPRPERWLR